MSATNRLNRRIPFRGRALLLLLPILCFGGAEAAAQGDSTIPVTTTPRVPLSPLSDPFPYELYNHSIGFDSVTGNVQLYEELLGMPFGQPRTLTLEEYIRRRQMEERRRLWEEEAAEYVMYGPKDEGDTLTASAMLDSLLSGGSPSFTIPLPQNPIFTLFGPPTIDINVNGNVNLSAGWQIDNNNLTSISSLSSTQSAPFFDQNIQVAVTGKIGNKLKLSTDFDTQRAFDVDNQMKISFGGGPESDDDILQLVEAGNVALETPSTLIGGSQTLFGVKTRMKFGKLMLTNILSQKRGERRVLKISGGSVKTQITVRPSDYAQNHFWLDTLYKGFYDAYFRNMPPSATPAMRGTEIEVLEVYEQVKDGAVPSQFNAIAYADLPALTDGRRYTDADRNPTTITDEVQRGSFIRLEKDRGYTYNAQLGTVTIRSLQRDKLYAVAYRTSDGFEQGELAAERKSDEVAVLKLIYVNNMQPNFRTLWARQMKNIYQLQGVRNVDLDNSSILITYGVPPDTSEIFQVGGGRRIMTILGVDRVNSSNQAIPDGKFDITNPAFFNKETGEITFPSTEPFRIPILDSLGNTGNTQQFVLNKIYDETRDEALRDPKVGKYAISGEISGSGGNRISLGAFGVPSGSVKVYKNGEQLNEGSDYRVDAIVGQVTLISPRAVNGSGDLEIEFEQNDLFTTSVKTLIGLRADYDLYSKRRVKSALGMTLMRYGQSTATDKIQVYSGEEPVLNTGIGFDGFVSYEAPFLTDFVNLIPGLETEAPSEVRFSGEWAAMLPEAKTQQELITADRDQSVVYIEDFESGAKRQIQLGINYTLWNHASPPVDEGLGATDSARVANKGKTWWYNISPSVTETQEIWPDRDVRTASTSTVLDLVFEPRERGIYNPNIGYEADPPLDSTWGGIMRSLSFFTTNLNEENIDFIEITLNAAEFDSRAKVYLDLGQISEDVIPNNVNDTEDGVTPQNPTPDDVLNEGEDVGYDGLTNEEERVLYGSNEEDPARDDYFFNAFRSSNRDEYKRVNGLQGNVGQERGPFPDEEDLNDNQNPDQNNSYFRYEIDLNPDPLSNPQIVGSGLNGWRQYRIPLRSGFSTIGTPSFSNVQFARVVVESPALTHVRIAEMNLVGSEWRNIDLAIGDSTIDPKLDISFVNIEDNSRAPDFYSLPPGVRPEFDPINDVEKNEQSLALTVRDMQRGEERGAIRVRPRSFDVFNYQKMRFFLHGSGELDDASIPGQPAKVRAYFRFGWDSLNYYEYRVPLLEGWNPYEIDFADIAALKQDSDPNIVAESPVPGKPGHTYAVRGNPSLTRVQFIAFGVENNAWPGGLNTTMWVNELRAVGARGGSDWAAKVTASAKLADFGTINYNASRTNPDFHRLEERFGDRVERTNWAFNSVFQLDKFLPESFRGSSIPVSYNHTERIENPQFISESDVDVVSAAERVRGDVTLPPDEASRQADSLVRSTETLVVQDALAFSDFRITFPGDSWLVRDVVNKFNFGFLYDQKRERSPLVEEKFEWQWDFRGAYGTRIPKNFTLKPFSSFLDSVPVLDFWSDFEINFLPTDVGVSATLHRERTTEKLRKLDSPSPVYRDFRANRRANFTWPILTGGLLNPQVDYNIDLRSSLTHMETDELGQQRSGGELADLLFFKDGKLFDFGLDNQVQQNFTFNARPRIPLIPNAERFFRPTASYRVDYNWEDLLIPAQGEGGDVTKSASFDARTTLGMTFFLKQLGNAIFGDQSFGRGPRRPAPDTTESRSAISTILRTLIKAPLLDWDQVQVNFTQDNKSKNVGLLGGNGTTNLWGRSLLFRSESPEFGPGAAYQLGLTRYPHGTLSSLFGGDVDRGLRAAGITQRDNFSQENNLTASTNRQLIPGMTLTLNWNTRWGTNQNYGVNTDEFGVPTYNEATTSGTLSRTFISLPFFGNDINNVVDEYEVRRNAIPVPVDPGPGATDPQITAFNEAETAYQLKLTETLSEVFEEKLEAFSFFSGDAATFLPSANWRLQWNGLHNLPFIKPWAQRASLTHEYRGQYTNNYEETSSGRTPQAQTVSRGFQPLIGINITGNQEFWKGTASASVNYNTISEFALVTAAGAEISKQLRNELQVSLSYLRRGLKLSILGLDLKNEIEFTTDFSLARQTTKRFNLDEFREEGNNDGSTRISFRPAIRYTVSRTVDATGFVSYEATIPDEEGSRDISRSTLKIGVDLRLKISGGR